MYEKTVHITNLSTDYDKAVMVAKCLYKTHKDTNSKLYIPLKWQLEEIKRDGTADKKVEPIIQETTEPKIQYPLSEKVANIGEIKKLTLGVTDSFTFDGRFGKCLCTKFIDADHNIFISFSQAKFMWTLNVGDTVYCTAEIKGHKQEYDEDMNVIYETHLTKIKGVN
tara:strand:- start:273 stop:773 length:501 start_codon:yes stop_codon:yes gene_type:complete